MRLPISTFASYSKGTDVCNIYISYLDSLAASSNQIVLGGMFFQEFFGIFVNDYNDPANPNQATQIYVGRNAKWNGYIGNEVLPIGPNPFVPIPPTPPGPTPSDNSSGLGTAWIVVIALIGCLLVAFLAFLLYKYKVATK